MRANTLLGNTFLLHDDIFPNRRVGRLKVQLLDTPAPRPCCNCHLEQHNQQTRDYIFGVRRMSANKQTVRKSIGPN